MRCLAVLCSLLLVSSARSGEAAWAWALSTHSCPDCDSAWKASLKSCAVQGQSCTCGCLSGDTCTCVQKQAYFELREKALKTKTPIAVFVNVDVPKGYTNAVRWDGYPRAKGQMVIFLKAEGATVVETSFQSLEKTAAKVEYDCPGGVCPVPQ